jgi:hypothetical protein
MRPIDFCTPKRSNRALVRRRFPARRPRGAALVPRLSPRARSRGRLLRALLPPSGDGGRDTERLGAARCERGRGVSRFTARRPLRRPDGCARSALSSERVAYRSPLAPLSPPPSLGAAPEGCSARRLEGRQDRFRGGLVKGVRFPDRRCLPSPGAACTAPAPRCGRVTLPSSIARRSRDEDRRASKNRLRFAPRAADARASVVCREGLGSRSRAPWRARGLSTRSTLVTRFPEPESVLTTSANTTMHGHRPRARDPRPRCEATGLPRAFASPPHGDDQGDEPRGACSRRSERARTGPTERR